MVKTLKNLSNTLLSLHSPAVENCPHGGDKELPTLTLQLLHLQSLQLEGNCHTKKATSVSQNEIPPGVRAKSHPSSSRTPQLLLGQAGAAPGHGAPTSSQRVTKVGKDFHDHGVHQILPHPLKHITKCHIHSLSEHLPGDPSTALGFISLSGKEVSLIQPEPLMQPEPISPLTWEKRPIPTSSQPSRCLQSHKVPLEPPILSHSLQE